MTEIQRRGFGAAAGSAFLLAVALIFQYGGGYEPCPLCIWQRWPHGIAVALGLLIFAIPVKRIAGAGALAMLTGAGIALYHAGIEYGIWAGPSTCTAPVAGDMEPDALLDQILDAPVVLCDQIAWSFMGISMAGWNALASLVLAGLWLRAYASSSASQ